MTTPRCKLGRRLPPFARRLLARKLRSSPPLCPYPSPLPPRCPHLQIRGVQAKYARWQGAARGGADRRALAAELEEECHSLEYMVTEIDKSIDAAERNPARFNLSQAELSDRRKWVMGTRRQLSGIASGLSAGAGAAQQPTNAAGRLAAAVQDENERFIQTEGDRQQLLMQ